MRGVNQLPAYVGSAQPGRSPWFLRAAHYASDPLEAVFRRYTPTQAEDLIRSAQRATGLEDLGPGEVIEPLQVLLDTVADDPQFSPLGRLAWTIILRRHLTSRLRIVDHVRKHPEVHDVVIEKPMIILGLPRTGTTLLYHLLGALPGSRPLMGWESYEPLKPAGPDLRLTRFRGYVWGVNQAMPALRLIHELKADAPDEGLELMDRTFHSLNFMLFAYDYVEYLRGLPEERMDESWELYLWQLQILQLQSMNDFWLLKAPGFIGAFSALDKHLPDARYIMTFRDLREALPSAMSLVTTPGTAFRRPGHQLGLPNFVDNFVGRVDYTRAQLADKPKVEVMYPDLMRDPTAEVRRILEEFGEAIPNDLDQRVDRVLSSKPQNKYGKHRYALEQFGFDPAELEPVAEAWARDVGLQR
jgi:hypothetical protein